MMTAFVPHHQVSANPNADVEARVRASFPDAPDMTAVAQCESGFRQFNADGSVLRGAGRYIGIFQIDEFIHRQRALDLAYDINTVDGNIAYARHLFSNSGTNPWKGCLQGAPVTPTPSPVPSGQLLVNLSFGMSHPDVLVVQKKMNASGFVLASSGPGSPGNETSYFGQLTREAVRKYQCAKAIVCAGNESTTGYGRVGPMTRASLN